jgi:putative oxidoreductase
MNGPMTLTRLIARPMLASMFIAGGINSLRNTEMMAERAKPVTDMIVPWAKKVAPSAPVPTDEKTWVRINAGVHIGAGLALAASLVPTTAAGHRFWEHDDKSARANQQTHFFKNMSMLGGLLIAAADNNGKPSVAWRAKHGAGTVRKEAKRARKQAKRAAKR